MTQQLISRRRFIISTAAAGGGLVLGFHIPVASAATVAPEPWTAPTDGIEINAWLTIDADGTVTIRVPHTEMGQGGMTSVALMIAEELDVEWDRVQAVFADPNRHLRNDREYVDMSTHGSNLVRIQHPHIMQAGASARERLKEAAARAWGMDRGAITAKQGVLSGGGRQAAYAEFAAAAAGVTLEREPNIKSPDQWWLLGRRTRRLDVDVKSDGSATYAIDVRVPDMVYAAVKCCPVPWGRLRGFDFDAIRNRPGVIAAVEMKEAAGNRRDRSDMQNGVAVVADSWYRAKTALDLMPVEWDVGPEGEVSNESLFARAAELLEHDGEVSAESGDDPRPMIDDAERNGRRVVAADYRRPYETHARMEPVNATVSVSDERVDVWSPVQDQSVAVLLAADQAGRDPRDVYVHTVFLGGGFGGNGAGATAVTRQATEISRQLGRPVKVIWTREEDIMNDKQRPFNVSRFRAALGDDGLPMAWFTRGIGERFRPGDADSRIRDMPYQVPNRRHERHVVASHIPTTTHRAPGSCQNGFAIESFVDEVALAGDWDPLEWRLAMTRHRDDWQRVLATLKEKSGFTTDLPRGEGMGVAAVECHGTICAACATVSVSRRGQLHVEKIVLVVDSGHIINPLSCEEQLEGGVCWELSHAWIGGLELRGGRFVNTNFDSYRLLRIDQMPEVEVHFELSGGSKWGGIGEPSGPPTPPAVANAIWFATGKRIRSTPFDRHDLSWT